LASITRLTLLALDRNLIASLPRDISSLVNLEILTLSKNKLASLPSLRSLRCLKQIDLRDNLLPASVSVVSGDGLASKTVSNKSKVYCERHSQGAGAAGDD
jgi:Leucine-rich repeat (LRR) protein